MPSELRLHDTTNPHDPKNTPDVLQASSLSAYKSSAERDLYRTLSIRLVLKFCLSSLSGPVSHSVWEAMMNLTCTEGYIIRYKVPRNPCKVLRNSCTMNHHELLYNLKANEMSEALPIRREATAFP